MSKSNWNWLTDTPQPRIEYALIKNSCAGSRREEIDDKYKVEKTINESK